MMSCKYLLNEPLRNWFHKSIKFDEFSVEINHRRTRSKEEEKTLRDVLIISLSECQTILTNENASYQNSKRLNTNLVQIPSNLLKVLTDENIPPQNRNKDGPDRLETYFADNCKSSVFGEASGFWTYFVKNLNFKRFSRKLKNPEFMDCPLTGTVRLTPFRRRILGFFPLKPILGQALTN